jgi:hypothetical protein
LADSQTFILVTTTEGKANGIPDVLRLGPGEVSMARSTNCNYSRIQQPVGENPNSMAQIM